MVGPVVGPQRLAGHVERLGTVRQRFEPRRPAELQQVSHQVTAILRRERREHVGGHQRADLRPLLDAVGRDAMALATGIHEDHGARRFLADDALKHAAVGEQEGRGPILGLDRPGRPVERFDDLLRRQALRDRRQLRPHLAPLVAHPVARGARGGGRPKHVCAPPRVAMSPGVDQSVLDELRAPLGRSRRLRRSSGDRDQPDHHAEQQPD